MEDLLVSPAAQPIKPRSSVGSFFKAHRSFLSVFVLLIALLLGAGLFTTVQLSQQSQDSRSRAATGVQATFTFSESSLALNATDEKTVTVLANTAGLQLTAGVFAFTYDPRYVTVSLAGSTKFPKILTAATIDDSTGKAQITLGVEPGAAIAGDAVPILSLLVKSKGTPISYTGINFDSAVFQAAALSQDGNVAFTNTNLGVTIQGDECNPTITFPTAAENEHVYDSAPRITYTSCNGYTKYRVKLVNGGNIWYGQPDSRSTIFLTAAPLQKQVQYTMFIQSCKDDTCTQIGGSSEGRTFYYQEAAAAATAPSAPTAVSAVAGNAQATVSFTESASTGASAITNHTVTASPGGATGTGASSPITVSGLTNGTAYTFSVTSTNAVGTSAASDASNAVTPVAPVQTTTPGAPNIATAVAGDTVAVVNFTAPASDGGSAITKYTVTASPGGATAESTGSPITVTGLTNGTDYTFTVTATNAVGTGAASAASNPVTPVAATATVNPKLDLTFKLQGLNKSGISIPTEITVKYTATGSAAVTKVFTKNYMSGENGVLAENSPLEIGGFDLTSTQGVAANAEIFVKTSTSLQKKIGTVTLEQNKVATLHTTTVLPVGDFKHGVGDTNIIKLNDIALALTQYIQLENPITDANRAYDVNFDNNYTLQDIVIVLTNFDQLEYPGENP